MKAIQRQSYGGTPGVGVFGGVKRTVQDINRELQKLPATTIEGMAARA